MDKLRIFDFDDTLVKSKSKVILTKESGEIIYLTPAEYAIYVPEAGDAFDYSQFKNSLVDPKQIKWTMNIFKKVLRKNGTNGLFILTARGDEAPITEYLEQLGIPEVKIIALGDSDPQAKSETILYMIKMFKPSLVEFFDDSIKNITKVGNMKNMVKKLYGTNLVTRHIKYDHHNLDENLLNEQEQEETKEFGQHIIHIEDLKPAQLLSMFKTINDGQDKFVVTEKMDGFFMSFGEDQQGFFAGTKNTLWRSMSDFPDVYFLAGLKNYIGRLQNIEILKSVQQVFNLKTTPSYVRITGESIPSYDHNIVLYDPNIVKDGIFVIYQMTIDNKQITSKEQIQKFISAIQPSTTVKFFTNPEVAFKYKVPKKIVIDLENLIKKHGNIFAKPARTPEEKNLKQELLTKIKQVGMLIKSDILKKPYKPVFGGDYEGFVVHLPDGSMVKIIDKDKFTKAKQDNWHFIDQLQYAERDFKKAIKADPNNLKSALSAFVNKVSEVKKDFEKNADKFISIPKKKNDTTEELKLYAKKLSAVAQLIKNKIPNQEIIDKYMNRQISESSSTMQEGGNVFKTSVNSVVPKQYLEPTIESTLNKIGLSNIDYKIVGNVNKPFLGDIDVALNTKELIQAYDLDTSSQDSFWSSLEDKLKSYSVEYSINKGFKQFHVSTSVIDKQGKNQFAFDSNGTMKQPKQKAIVQIDFFVGSVPWMTKVLSGAPQNSKYKAYYRNVLLRSIVSIIRDPKKPGTRFILDFRNGVELVKYEMVPPTGKQKKEQYIEHGRTQYIGDADLLTKWLFGPNYSWEDINTFEELSMLFMSSEFQFPEYRDEIKSKFKKEIMKDKMDKLADTSEFINEESPTTEDSKTIGLFLGGFKPFHKGHMAGVEMASSLSDEVFVIASLKDRDKGGFAMSGSIAKEFWTKYVMTTLPSNVEVIFSDKPYNELVHILHDIIEPSNNKVIIFGDKDDLIKNFGGKSYKKLQKYIPNILSQNRISIEQVPRVYSGTKMRDAILNKNYKDFINGLPKLLLPKAKEIYKFFQEKTNIKS